MAIDRSLVVERGSVILLAAFGVLALPLAASERKLTDLTLAELMNEPVTSVSKKETPRGESATAITVITPEDMRRLGITSIPEALRLVPGFDVARIDGSTWAISARGLNFQHSLMLLVLIDGRSVYTPSHGGVHWDSQDVPLENLERIEVIRGPGATLWGANAVNGVVNIITKQARDTQGALLSGSIGTEDRPALDAQYGGAVGDAAHYRVYARYFNRESLSTGEVSDDPWHCARFGFRSDWQPHEDRLVTLQGDSYSMQAPHFQVTPLPAPPFTELSRAYETTRGFNVTSRWTERLSDRSHVSVQAYFDSFARFTEELDTSDVQLEHRFPLGARHDVVWGAGYRHTQDDITFGYNFTSTPRRAQHDLYTAFVQDEITLLPGLLRATPGVKLEHNDYTGLEIQPNLRMLFTPARGHTVWASASRAVSTPNRLYSDTIYRVGALQPPDGLPIVVALWPNPDLPVQKLRAWEAGYRIEPSSRLSLDLAVFYNEYRDIYGGIEGAPFFEGAPVPHLTLPVIWNASLHGDSHGAEVSVEYRPLDVWRVSASYSWLQFEMRPFDYLSSTAPEQQMGVRSYANLTPRLELNGAAFYVDRSFALRDMNANPRIDAYVRVDVGLLWRPSPSLEIGVWGQNLLDGKHPETASQDTQSIHEVKRSFVARVSRRF